MFNLKRFAIISVAIAFAIAVIAACVFLFSVKKVSAEFTVYGDSQAEEIQKDLDAFTGKSLLFLDTDDVYKVCEKYPYYQITSVKKSYPNVLEVSVVKRVEAFKILSGDSVYVIDGEGVILNDTGATEYSGNVIPISLNTVEIERAVVGEKIKTADDALLCAIIKSAGDLGLCDLVKSIEIDDDNLRRNAVITTNTGVQAVVWDVEISGGEKIEKAFEVYETLGDYEKTDCWITAYKENGGAIKAKWTAHDPFEE
ncbi:MAG: FtsQ-type POTRA domain-containing protein [Clostridia bacterium]|nr:FtsQ-type POTRA domain-containing protein [Clostridia bacterium]